MTETRSGPMEPYKTLVKQARRDWKAAKGDPDYQAFIVTKLGSLVVRAVLEGHLWGAHHAATAYAQCAPRL